MKILKLKAEMSDLNKGNEKITVLIIINSC